MGRSPSSAEVGLNRGAWTSQEDKTLIDYINLHGEGRWRNLPRKAGLKRCGKSCRLRWMNYLRPDIKRGNISPEEDDLIIRLHKLLGNRWSLIAGRLPGRTDNEIKNYWNTNLSKKIQEQQAVPSGSSSSVVGKTSKKSNNVHYGRRSLSHNMASPSTSSQNAVRPKAHKCTKVFFDQRQLPHNNEHTIADRSSLTSSTPCALETSTSTPNYMTDFELFMTNLLRSDISTDDRLFWEETTMLPQQYRGNDPAVQNNAVLSFQTSLNSFLDDGHGDWLACLRG